MPAAMWRMTELPRLQCWPDSRRKRRRCWKSSARKKRRPEGVSRRRPSRPELPQGRLQRAQMRTAWQSAGQITALRRRNLKPPEKVRRITARCWIPLRIALMCGDQALESAMRDSSTGRRPWRIKERRWRTGTSLPSPCRMQAA